MPRDTKKHSEVCHIAFSIHMYILYIRMYRYCGCPAVLVADLHIILVLLHSKHTVVGHGQFGEVFKGIWDTPYGPQEVAIKMLKEASSDVETVKFLQEAAIMAQFRHPHIVRLLGSVTVDKPVSDGISYVEKHHFVYQYIFILS